MAESGQSSAPRPITPNPDRSSNSQLFSTPGRPLPIQTPSAARPSSNIGPLSPVDQNGSFAFDRVIKRGKVERRVKKKGAWKSSWKPAYLVLRPNLLSVYKDEDETELRASITLSDVTAVAPVKKPHHDHVFGIFSPSKNHHFSGLSARETSDWIAVIRLEARTEAPDDLQPPNAGFKRNEGQGYDTTDLSADDDPDAPASPETPHWAVRGQKTRSLPQSNLDPRRASGLTQDAQGSESFATSQSDLSDAFSSSIPGTKGYLSSAGPVQHSALTPIPDDAPSPPGPAFDREGSYISDTGAAQPSPISRSAPKYLPPEKNNDPSRVIRQGHLKLSKTISGVKQWKSIWVVLRTQSLAFYKSNSEYSPLIIIPTYNIIEAAEIDRKNKPNCFQVIGEEKTYRLQAETEDELESWLGALKSVLVKQEAERSRSRGTSVNLQAGEQKPVQPPGSRDGLGGLTAQMRTANITDSHVAKRMVSSNTAAMSGPAQDAN